jgi:hypothetical protein
MVVCISLGHNGFLLKNNSSHEILIQGIVHKPTYIRTIPCSLLKAIPIIEVDITKQATEWGFLWEKLGVKMSHQCHFTYVVHCLLFSLALALLTGCGPKPWDEPPLHWAAFKGHLDVAKVLIAKGAKVNVLTKKNSTPLRLATTYKQREMIKFLKSRGAR